MDLFNADHAIDRPETHRYLAQHQILPRFDQAIREILSSFPANPYFVLVEHCRQHELEQSMTTGTTDDLIYQRIRSKVDGDTDSGIPLHRFSDNFLYWTMNPVQLVFVDQRSVRRVYSQYNALLQPTTTDDKEYALSSLSSVALQSVLHPDIVGHVPALEINRDVFVSGMKFESALTMYARFILQEAVAISSKSRHQLLGIDADGNTNWVLNDILSNRNAFFRAVKRSTIELSQIIIRVIFVADTNELSTRPQVGAGPGHLSEGKIIFRFHYQASSSNTSSSYKSFDVVPARSGLRSVFFSRPDMVSYASRVGRQESGEGASALDAKYIAELKASLETGNIYQMALVHSLIGSERVPASVGPIGFMVRLNGALPGTLQAIIAPLAAVLVLLSSKEFDKFQAVDGNLAIVRSQFTDITTGLQRMTETHSNSDLIALTPHLQRVLNRIGDLEYRQNNEFALGPPTISILKSLLMALQSLQNTVALNALRNRQDLVEELRELLEGKEQAMGARQPSNHARLLAEMTAIGAGTRSRRRMDRAASERFAARHQIYPEHLIKEAVTMQYIVDSELDLSMTNSILDLTTAHHSVYPFADLAHLFTIGALALEPSLRGYRPLTRQPVVAISPSLSVSTNINANRSWFGSGAALAVCDVALMRSVESAAGNGGILPITRPPAMAGKMAISFGMSGDIIRSGVLIDTPRTYSFQIVVQIETLRPDTAIDELIGYLGGYIAQVQRQSFVQSINVGARSWTYAQFQQSSDAVGSAIRSACVAKDTIAVVGVFLSDGSMRSFSATFDLIHVNPSSGRVALYGSVNARLSFETVLIAGDAAQNWIEARSPNAAQAMKLYAATIRQYIDPDQVILATIGCVLVDPGGSGDDPDLFDELGRYRGSLPQRLMSSLNELITIRQSSELSNSESKRILSGQYDSWRQRLDAILSDPVADVLSAMRPAILSNVERLRRPLIDRPDAGATTDLAERVERLGTIMAQVAFDLFRSTCPRIDSLIARYSVVP